SAHSDHADLLIGQKASATYSYEISDGNGGTDTATVDLDFCGSLNTLETIKASLPASGTMVVGVENGEDFYSITLTGTGDARLDGQTFDIAYCVSRFLPLEFDTPTSVSISLADEASAPDSVKHSENLDLVNWILNQDFGSMDNGDGKGQTYTEAEIQGAIWGLTDDFVYINEALPGFGTKANAQEIYDLALANGEGFEAGEGDIIGLILDPHSSHAPLSEQPLIIGVNWDDLAQDCLCY
ncbi:thioester domain-containing protein, partial [Paracoccus sp. (in: a-proteobacteria)]|uniref:thioester domain-containing protein n=1 Tax=Paracoccus sp. TaxID=267 RepID=UPI0035B3EFCA